MERRIVGTFIFTALQRFENELNLTFKGFFD
jgi:hypothetical protein